MTYLWGWLEKGERLVAVFWVFTKRRGRREKNSDGETGDCESLCVASSDTAVGNFNYQHDYGT